MLRENTKESPYEIAPISLTEPESVAVREQMTRMLAHPLFRSGRRCPALFQFVVEQALDKNLALLKERIIGIEVFGRTPDYDTNADSVVRTAAAELRKRIAQYYQEPGHEAEVRIELHSGSYVPDFRVVSPDPTETPHLTVLPPPVAIPAASAHSRRLLFALAVTALLLCVTTGALIVKSWRPATPLDKFWSPVVSSPGTALLCVGQRLKQSWAPDADASRNIIPSDPTPPSDVPLFKFYWMAAQNVVLPDVISISRLGGLLESKGKAFRVLQERNATFDDLRAGPAILIGGYRNPWISRLMSHWRFSSASEGRVSWVHDRDNPAHRSWSVDFRLPYTSITEDYGIVSRAVDPTTGRPVVVVAGTAGYGTMAAAEFATDPAEIREIEKIAPPNWERKSFQIVLKTNVIGKSAGPPMIVASQFW
jgi:hypothetical protein